MKLSWVILLISFSAAFAFADCDATYNDCITRCCTDCGSTLSYNANGDLVCDVGTEENPDQACISVCLPCASDYQECVASEGATGYPAGGTSGLDTGGSGCGAPLVFGLAAAFAFFRK